MAEYPDADVLEYARDDLKFLLDRGYRKDSALGFVGDHHHLDARARNRLMRETFSDLEIADTESKLMGQEALRGRILVIDGFNVLITVEAGLGGGEVFLSQDGVVRDNAMAFANYRISPETDSAVDAVLQVLQENPPALATWVFDSQVANSGRLAEHVRRRMEEMGLKGKSMTAPDADTQILKLNGLTATSDTQLIRRLETVIDLPGAVFMAMAQSDDAGAA